MAVAYRSGEYGRFVLVFEEAVAGDTEGCAGAGEKDAVTHRWLSDTGCQGWCQRLVCGGKVSVSASK